MNYVYSLEEQEKNKRINYKKFYRPKKYVISKNELKFYEILLEIAKEMDLILFSQVSLYNIVVTQNYLNYEIKEKFFNKINRKSIDFILVNKKDCRIKLCIELDDNTHNMPERIKRDKFINELFEDLNIPIMRYPVMLGYGKNTLKSKILENIKDTWYEY